jgi:hypothetical protein
VSADVRGGVRAWPLPPRLVSVLAETHERIYGAIYDSRDKMIVANTSGSELFTYSKTKGVSPVTLHTLDTPFMRPAADGSLFATYGSSALVDGTVWIYSSVRRTWLCLMTSTTELTQLMFDDTESTALLFDVDGRLISVDLKAARRALDA